MDRVSDASGSDFLADRSHGFSAGLKSNLPSRVFHLYVNKHDGTNPS